MQCFGLQVVALVPPYDCGSGSEPTECDGSVAHYSSGQQILASGTWHARCHAVTPPPPFPFTTAS